MQTRRQEQSKPAPSGSSPAHVLLIEDDDTMRDMLAEALRREGYRVTECVDASRWLQACGNDASSWGLGQHGEGDTYDVVVSDIRMPNISGLDALRMLKVMNPEQDYPSTIFITAFGDDETRRRACNLGAVTVLDKPFAVKDLVASVREAIGTQDRPPEE